MPEQQPSDGSSGPTIRRAAELSARELPAEHRQQLERHLEGSRGPREREGTSELVQRAYQPILRLIESDADAKAAFGDLQVRGRAEFDERVRVALEPRRDPVLSGPGMNVIPDVRPGSNLFGAPYDFEVQKPEGIGAKIHASRMNGTFGFFVSERYTGGSTWATAGLGLALEAGATGMAHVRPGWRYEFSAWASGNILASHTEGAAKVVVQDAINGEILDEKPVALWSFDDDHSQTASEWIDSWSLGLDFLVHEGQLFFISFLATGMVDYSGEYAFASSWASATLDMSLPFVIVDLGPT